MKSCGVLFTALLTCFVAAENFNPSVPVARHLSSRIKRQNTGGDPNLEGIFGQQSGNVNPPQFGNNGQSGQPSSSSNERPQFGFGFSGLDQGSSGNNGGGLDNFGTGSNNQNQGTSGNGGFNNFGSNQGTSNNGGFDNQGSNQWPSSNSGGFGNNQGSLCSGINTQNVQRPQTTQRTPLNQISLQTTINDGDCLRGCRNRLTQQYNPICGSDNISYSNRQVFDCYQRECRQDVHILYAGSCVTTRAPTY